MNSRMGRVAVLALLAALSFGCASTTMTKAWVYPETGPLKFEKVMALVLIQDKFQRRAGEDELVRQIKKASAVAAYTVLPDDQLQNEDKIKEIVSASGADGIIVMRPMYDRTETNYVPGTYPTPYYSFWGYYSYAYPIVYSPGYIKTDRLLGVETNIYQVSDGKLVWSGLSQTKNPKDARKAVADTARVVRSAMKKYGFIS